MSDYAVTAVHGLGEIVEGTDLGAAIVAATELQDGDVLVVTSKVVSKAEGRVVRGTKEELLAAETDRVVARRGDTSIVRTRHGLVMAGAGIDASNTEPGTLVLLPADPDASARTLRRRIADVAGLRVGVVVSDTSGRAWRTGQTDIAVGAAGVEVLDDHQGRHDGYGNALAVTAPALADELAAAADLAKGKVGQTPVAVIRGLAELVLPADQDGAGAASLVRPEGLDMFGLGAREAVLRALAPTLDEAGTRGFGAPSDAATVAAAARGIAGLPPGATIDSADVDGVVTLDPGPLDPRSLGRLEARIEAVSRAHAWRSEVSVGGDRIILRPWAP